MGTRLYQIYSSGGSPAPSEEFLTKINSTINVGSTVVDQFDASLYYGVKWNYVINRSNIDIVSGTITATWDNISGSDPSANHYFTDSIGDTSFIEFSVVKSVNLIQLKVESTNSCIIRIVRMQIN